MSVSEHRQREGGGARAAEQSQSADPRSRRTEVRETLRRGAKGAAAWVLTSALLLAGLAFNSILFKPVLPITIRDTDFLGFYAGALLAGTGSLYDIGAVVELETKYSERPRILAFIRLPFYAGMLSPLRLLSYREAFWVWRLFLLAAAIAFVGLWPGSKPAAAAVCAWSIPLFNCFIVSQDAVLLLPLVAVAVRSARRRSHSGLGVVCAFLSVKYHLFFTLPVLFVRRRLWRTVAAAAAAGLVLMAWSFLQEGWRWPISYSSVLRLPTTTPPAVELPNLHGLFMGWSGAGAWEAVASLLVLAAVWLAGSDRWNRSLAAVLIGGLLLSYHAFLADCTLLIPASLLLLEDERLLYRAGGLLLAAPALYLGEFVPNWVNTAVVCLILLILLAAPAAARALRGHRAAEQEAAQG